MSQTLPVNPTSLPTGFCPSSYQEMLNGFSAHQNVVISDSAAGGIYVASAKPVDETRPWLRLDQFGRPDRIYVFAQGAWISLHTLVPGLTQWWFDVLPDFTVFDGGDNNPAISSLAGPMWLQATKDGVPPPPYGLGVPIEAQFPVTVGTLASGLVLGVSDTGGEEKHVLITTELASHSHSMTTFNKATASGEALSPSGGLVAYPSVPGTPIPGSTDVTPTVAAIGHNTMPPYVVGYLLQRTTRQFYRVP